MKLLILNDVVKEIANDKLYRVVYMDKKQGICTLIEMNTNAYVILNIEVSKIESEIKHGNWTIAVDDEEYSFIPEGEMRKKTKEVYLQRNKIVDAVLEKVPEPHIYTKRYRVAGHKAVAEEIGVSEKTVKRTMLMYLQSGKKKVALIPPYNKCGAPGIDRFGDVKNGRKQGKVHFNEYVNYQSEHNGSPIKDHFKNIQKTIKKYLLRNTGISIKKAYRLMIADLYTEENEWGVPVSKPYHEVPTFSQFYYQLQKFRKAHFSEYKRLRMGEKKYRLEAKATQSSAVADAIMPGHVYEIDATRPHVILLDRHRKNVIGTPVVFYVVDKFTKMVVSLSVGLDAPGWNGASSALLNITENKADFASKYGVELAPEEWIDVTMPQIILADNGEFSNNLPVGLIEELGITIQNAPSGAGDAKGTVEKMFHLTEQELFGLIPGFSKKNYRDRGETDLNQKARFTLEEITQAYINYVKLYNQKEMKKYPTTLEMKSDKLFPTPNNVWNWMKDRDEIYQVRITQDKIKSALLRRATGKVTDSGVRLFGIYYVGDVAYTEGWFDRAKNMGFYDIPVKYDERDLNRVFVFDSKAGRYVEFQISDASALQYKNLNYSEKAFYDAIQKITSLKHINEQMYQHVTFYKNIIRLNKLADSKYVDINLKDKPNTTEKRKNRKAENKAVRKEQAITLTDKPDTTPIDNVVKMPVASDGETFQERRQRIKREKRNKAKEVLNK